ncbi:hypothetical protein [Sorangium cellulosum]|uniref:Uncharacterized protein n=1 Tax=Sorangium cellulosum TaxID=56 RepID=A0A150QSD3_SORCE|nr:hypothetical protein [Sorangium cellulosum]KYF70860.1 hypothetical protein BE15_30610 [Sorangium cellulosum]
MQAPTNVVHAGLGLTEDQTMDLLCQAFRQAVDDYCAAPQGQRGGFNNFFFNSLRNLPPPNTQMGQALAGEIVREAPIFVGAVQGTAQAVAAAPTVAGNVGPVAQALAGAYQQAAVGLTGGMGAVTGMVAGPVGNCLGIGAMFQRGFARWRVLAQNGVRLRFPDGLIGNRIVEVKGPADWYRNPRQRADYQAFCAPNAPLEPDCASCDANCENGPLPRGDDGCR